MLRSIPLIMLLGFSAIQFGCGIFNSPLVENIKRERDTVRTELKSICDNLPPPTTFQKITTSEMIKPESGAYGFIYKGEITCEEVKQHYSKILLADGWSFEQKDSMSIINSYTKTDLFFHKGEHSIRITCEKKNSVSREKEYALGCSWNLH